MSDLSFLENVTPVQTEFQKSARGRQPGKNVMEAHVVASFSSPKPLAVEVPAGSAHLVERAIRRAGNRPDGTKWTVSVQVLRVHPSKASKDDVIPLREVSDLTTENDGDVWISFKAMTKEAAKEAVKSGDAPNATEAPADPFIENGTGDADKATENGDAAPAPAAKTPAVRKSVKA